MKNNNLNNEFPHCPDLAKRLSEDNGFSQGWGMHFKPIEDYFIDSHVHFEDCNMDGNLNNQDYYLTKLHNYNIKHLVMILPMLKLDSKDIYKNIEYRNTLTIDEVKSYYDKLEINEVTCLLYLDYNTSSLELVKESLKLGINGIKLHNAPMIMDGKHPNMWLSDEWKEIFNLLNSQRIPVLWHVTQRLSSSKYSGGQKNTYWKTGWEKSITYNNYDLLDTFLKIVKTYPDIPFIGAHQLFLGWERLKELFNSYENLYIDTSVGCILNTHDNFYRQDSSYLRDIFIKYSNLILFGTDYFIENISECKSLDNFYNKHIRFLRKLNLPYDVLQNISHLNAEKLYNIKITG